MTIEPDRVSTVGTPNCEHPRHPERLAYSPAEAAAALGVSRSSLYLALRRGDVHSRTLGGRRLVPRAELDRLLGLDEA